MAFRVDNAVWCCLLLLALCASLTNNASLSAKEQKKYKNLIEGQGLFSRDDDVEILTVDNFKSELYGQNHAWLIEFYNSWCGFCQRFAPSWKALASDIRGWKDLIKVGAIDCTNEDNAPVCREFEVMSYPTLRYYHENYEEDSKNLGDAVQKGDDMDSHRRLLLAHIIKEQREGKAKIYPNLTPYSYPNANHLYDSVPAGTKFVFLIIEKEGAPMGAEVAMDLHTVPEIVIRYTPFNNTELIKLLGITKLPTMVVVGADKTTNQFAQGLKTRESMRMAIKQFLKPKDIVVPDAEPVTEVYTGKWLDSEVPDMSALMEARRINSLKEKVSKMGDVVFQMDLETALRFSLKREIARVKTISGEKFQALLAYLNVVIKYFPLSLQGHRFFTRLREKVVESGDEINGKDISNFVKSEEAEHDNLFSSPENWLACEGSSPEFRGYPCGLWKMFHYLTVNAAEKNADDPKADPLEVLRAMEGYIRNFFGCADCAQHFLDMVKTKDMKSVESLDSSILWLWMAHNSANKRLAGDQTEDPDYPKIQFPSKDHCGACRNADDSWNFIEVAKYLKHMYGSINIRYLGSDARIVHSFAEGDSPSSSGSGVFKGLDTTRLPEKALRARLAGESLKPGGLTVRSP